MVHPVPRHLRATPRKSASVTAELRRGQRPSLPPRVPPKSHQDRRYRPRRANQEKRWENQAVHPENVPEAVCGAPNHRLTPTPYALPAGARSLVIQRRRVGRAAGKISTCMITKVRAEQCLYGSIDDPHDADWNPAGSTWPRGMSPRTAAPARARTRHSARVHCRRPQAWSAFGAGPAQAAGRTAAMCLDCGDVQIAVIEWSRGATR